jgi:two-component system, OmpR family, phosphate regulon sensor histidine kinase PhoR
LEENLHVLPPLLKKMVIKKIDTVKGARGTGPIPPVFIPMLDSIVGGPENIKSIKIDNKEKKGKVISITYSDKSSKDSLAAIPEKVFVRNRLSNIRRHDEGEVIKKDSLQKAGDPIFRFMAKIDSIYAQDSVTLNEVTTAYTNRLKKDDINVPFTVERLDSSQVKSEDAVTFGFRTPVSFELSLGSTLGYLLNKLKLPILFSVLLVGLTIAAFLLLYRNMMKQKRLAEMKNDLISNISHELKTPIATVGVALEALKSFNAMHDPARTKEYLDISQSELQRLNLLVDKVLKLSIFEKKDIELKKERFDYRQLTSEIMNSMRLQFEKYHANVNMHTEGDSFYVDADKLHITSVVYNLLDNALKYGSENPVINIKLVSDEKYVKLIVQDNGIGIPAEYKTKIFEKFFRVPTGDKHNIKGYGLGLSYVAEVVKRHEGEITVESEYGKGSTFTVALPLAKTPIIALESAYASSSASAVADKEASADKSKKQTS